jgi:hypothetical protein
MPPLRTALPKFVFIAVFLSTALLLFINLGAYLSCSLFWGSALVVTLAAPLFLGMSYDFAELVTAALSPQCYPPRFTTLDRHPAVALLYVTRHDASESCLKTLLNQDYNNSRLFVLDDSDDNRQTHIFRSTNCVVCRRNSRKGYKAGNLNNWLRQYGRDYEYFVIADADSRFSPSFVTDMLKYAEHPANRDVAIFQSRILPWNSSTRFTTPLSVGAKVRMRVSSRISNALNTLLSYGHNNLHRTGAILALGGFPEALSPEDTTVSLALSEFGLKCRLVDVDSYDAEPRDLSTYLRRTARWCQQTVEMLRYPWHGSDWTSKVAVLRNLLSYGLHLVYPSLLLATMLVHRVEAVSFITGLQYLVRAQRLDLLLVWAAPLAIFFASLCLHLWHALRSGVTIREYVSSLPVMFAVTSCSAPVVAVAFWREARGKRVVFHPTNETNRLDPAILRLPDLCALCWFPVLLAAAVCLLSVFRPFNLLAYANILWVSVAAVTPLTVWFTHRNVSTE